MDADGSEFVAARLENPILPGYTCVSAVVFNCA
jgi:hypothetical protein